MTAVGAAADKATLRRAVLARRAHLPEAARAAAGPLLSAAVLPLLSGDGPVAAYLSAGSEPPTGPLLDALEGRALLPVLTADGDLDWARWDGRVQPGRRRTREPVGPRLGRDALAGCVLVVVPALSVDRQGVRLGRGGGAYDRALRRTAAPVVALLHDGELVDRLPAEPHDVAVTAAATPSAGLVRLPGRIGS